MSDVIKLPSYYQGERPDADTIKQETSKGKKGTKKRSFGSVFLSRLPRYFMYAVIGYIGFSFGDQIMQINDMNREVAKVNQQLASLEERNQDLKEEIKNLQSKTYVERIAREKLGLVKPGEVVILEAKTNDQVKIPDREAESENNIH